MRRFAGEKRAATPASPKRGRRAYRAWLRGSKQRPPASRRAHGYEDSARAETFASQAARQPGRFRGARRRRIRQTKASSMNRAGGSSLKPTVSLRTAQANPVAPDVSRRRWTTPRRRRALGPRAPSRLYGFLTSSTACGPLQNAGMPRKNADIPRKQRRRAAPPRRRRGIEESPDATLASWVGVADPRATTPVSRRGHATRESAREPSLRAVCPTLS